MMKNTKHIKIATDFSNIPKGRTPDDGKYNGERFRKEFLEGAYNEYDKIIIDLDDLYGCPSSFREEAFGGLVRSLDLDPNEVLEKLEFIATNRPPLIDTIKQDILHAKDK